MQDPSPWASDSPRALGITSQSKQANEANEAGEAKAEVDLTHLFLASKAAPEETLLEVPEAGLTTSRTLVPAIMQQSNC